MDELPIYQITIDPDFADNGEELGIDMIAFTKTPAIKVKGMAFTNEEPTKMVFKDDLKMRIAAPAMIPSKIYRRDEEDGKEYYVEFTAEVIEQLHQKFMHNLSNKNIFNVEHDENLKAPAYILEALLLNTQEKVDMIKKDYGIEVPKGSLFIVSQVTNQKYYEALVSQDRIGYSIEGFLGMKLSEQINNKQMDKTTYELNGKFFEIIDGKLSEVVSKEVALEEVKEEEEVEMEEQPKEEELAEEPKEEELADEPKEEEKEEVEMEVNPEADAEAILEVVTPLLDAFKEEVMNLLAEMRNEQQAPVEEEEAIEMSANQRFSQVVKFLND